MTNPNPRQDGLQKFFTQRHLYAQKAVRETMVTLSSRTDLKPQHALSALCEMVDQMGVSRRSLQRHFSVEIDRLRESCRQNFRSATDKQRWEVLQALDAFNCHGDREEPWTHDQARATSIR